MSQKFGACPLATSAIEKRDAGTGRIGAMLSLVTADRVWLAESVIIIDEEVQTASTAYQVAEQGSSDVAPVDCRYLEAGAIGK
jgi:hypothetical protein